MRILVADEHEVVRKGIRTLLNGRPEWEICAEAATSYDAVAKTEQLKPDVVLLDITMPGLNGLEAVPKLLKAHPPARILVFTVHESSGEAGVLTPDAARALMYGLEALETNKVFLSPRVTNLLENKFRQNQDERAPDVLTARETEVFKDLAKGKSNKEVAHRLGISPRTIEAHRAHIMDKLQLRTLSDLVHYAIRHKLVEL